MSKKDRTAVRYRLDLARSTGIAAILIVAAMPLAALVTQQVAPPPREEIAKPIVTSSDPRLIALQRESGASWKMQPNQVTGTARHVWGGGLIVHEARNADRRELERIARAHVDTHGEVFGVPSSELRTEFVRSRGDRSSVMFQQTYRGVPVLGARAYVLFRTDLGKIIAFGSDAIPSVEIDVAPTISADEARRREQVAVQGKLRSERPTQLWIVPRESESGDRFALAWRVVVEDPLLPTHWVSFVDAHSGELVSREKLEHNLAVKGKVEADVELDGNCGPETRVPLGDLLVEVVGGNSDYTDENGNFVIPNQGAGQVTVSATFTGEHIRISDYENGDGGFSGTFTPGLSQTIVFDDTNSSVAERAAYRHLYTVYQQMLDWEIEFPDLPQQQWIANQDVWCTVNLGLAECNATAGWGFGYDQIMCGSAGADCVSTGRIPSVIYHEYAHLITNRCYGDLDLGTIPPLDLAEGNSDVLAFLLTDESIIAKGMYIDPADCQAPSPPGSDPCACGLRDAENMLQYPEDTFPAEGTYYSLHLAGRVIAGFVWDIYADIRAASGANVAKDTVGRLWFDTLYLGNPPSQNDQVYWTFILDEDPDGDPTNGSVNSVAITNAANNHGYNGDMLLDSDRFEDVSALLPNLGGTVRSVAWGDYDDDGDPDLYLAKDGANQLFRNDGGSFVEIADVDVQDSGDSHCAAFVDIDGDRDLDLFIGNKSADNGLIFYDSSTGDFSTATPTSLAQAGDVFGVVSADVDEDGDLDLYLAGPARLFLQDASGDFVDYGVDLGTPGWSYGGALGDYDGDGDIDIYTVHQTTPGFSNPDKLLRNDSGTFVDVTPASLDTDGNGRGAQWFDYDNDGDLDLFVYNERIGARGLLVQYGYKSHLYRNDGLAGFVEVALETLHHFASDGATWQDFDNDGALDVFLAGHDSGHTRLMFGDAAAGFADETGYWVTEEATSVASADFDGDGDMDLFVGHPAGGQLLSNAYDGGNHWLKVRLDGAGANEHGVGARVQVTQAGASHVQYVAAGFGHGQSDYVLHFGLGSSGGIATINVIWPNGQTQNVVSGIDKLKVVTQPGGAKEDPDLLSTPPAFALHAASPNPFNPQTVIAFSIDRESNVTLGIYSSRGELIAAPIDERLPAGTHQVLWDGRDASGRRVSSGVYYYRLTAGERSLAQRLVLLK